MINLTHDKIMELKNSAEKTYVWDFALAEGDTIKEKFRDLAKKINYSICYGNRDEIFVVANYDIEICIETITTYHYLIKDEDLGGGITSTGNIGYFELYRDVNFPKDEVLVCHKNKPSIIKIYNFVKQ